MQLCAAPRARNGDTERAAGLLPAVVSPTQRREGRCPWLEQWKRFLLRRSDPAASSAMPVSTGSATGHQSAPFREAVLL